MSPSETQAPPLKRPRSPAAEASASAASATKRRARAETAPPARDASQHVAECHDPLCDGCAAGEIELPDALREDPEAAYDAAVCTAARLVDGHGDRRAAGDADDQEAVYRMLLEACVAQLRKEAEQSPVSWPRRTLHAAALRRLFDAVQHRPHLEEAYDLLGADAVSASQKAIESLKESSTQTWGAGAGDAALLSWHLEYARTLCRFPQAWAAQNALPARDPVHIVAERLNDAIQAIETMTTVASTDTSKDADLLNARVLRLDTSHLHAIDVLLDDILASFAHGWPYRPARGPWKACGPLRCVLDAVPKLDRVLTASAAALAGLRRRAVVREALSSFYRVQMELKDPSRATDAAFQAQMLETMRHVVQVLTTLDTGSAAEADASKGTTSRVDPFLEAYAAGQAALLVSHLSEDEEEAMDAAMTAYDCLKQASAHGGGDALEAQLNDLAELFDDEDAEGGSNDDSSNDEDDDGDDDASK